MSDGNPLLRFLNSLAISVLAGAANHSLDLSGRFTRMLGIALTDTAGTLWVFGLTFLAALLSFQVFRWDEKLREWLLRGRRLRFEWNPLQQPLVSGIRPGEWCIHVKNRSSAVTVSNVRVVISSYRRENWATPMHINTQLLEVSGRSDVAPGDTLSFRLAQTDYLNDTRAVQLAPGTKPENWMPRGAYLFDVSVFGGNTAPDKDCYRLEFLEGQPGTSFGRCDPNSTAVVVGSPVYNPRAT